MVTLANDISNFDIIQSMLQFKALGFGFLVFLDKKKEATQNHICQYYLLCYQTTIIIITMIYLSLSNVWFGFCQHLKHVYIV